MQCLSFDTLPMWRVSGESGVVQMLRVRKDRSEKGAVLSLRRKNGRRCFVKKRKTRARAVIAAAPDGTETGYPSVSLAAERTGGQAARISAACRTGVPYKGVLWMYEEEAKRAK